MSFPSGRQFDLAFGDQRAVVVEVGGGLRSYSVGGRELVDGYRADEPVESGRGQVLIPWPNRVRGGRYEFDGRLHQLALTEPENGNAIHGLVRWAAWNDADREPHRVAMEHTLHPQPGYPFSLELRIEYELSETGLAVRTRAANVGAARCPFGAGAHPYVTLGTASVDQLILHIPARTVLDSDEHGVPIGTHPVAGTDFDFREARPIADTKLDHAFTDLERGGDDLARVTLSDPETAAGLTVWVDGTLVQAASNRTYSDGKVLTFNGQQSVMVWTGSSGTTYFTVNGKSLGHLGPSGVSETWLFSPSGPP